MRINPKAVVPLVVFLASVAVYSLYFNRGVMLADEGSLVHATQRVLKGQVPYRDFYHFYAPGRFYILAGLFKMLGERFLVSRMMWVVVRAACVTMVFLVAVRLMPRSFALLPAAFTLLVPGPWFKSFFAFSGLLALLAVLRYVEKMTSARAVLCALAVAAALLLRQDVGLVAAIAVIMAIVLGPLVGRGSGGGYRRAACHLALAGLVAAVVILPVVLFFYVRSALEPMVNQLFFLAPGLTLSRWHSFFFKVWKYYKSDPVMVLLFCIPPLVICTCFVHLIRRIFKEGFREEELKILLVLFVGAAMVVPAYLPAALIRLYQCGPVIWIIATYILWLVHNRPAAELSTRRLVASRRSRALRAVSYLGIVVLFAALVLDILLVKRAGLASTDYSGTIRIYFKNDWPVVLRGERLYLTRQKARRLRRLVSHVKTHTSEEEAIIVFPNQSMLYFFCERPNPTRFIGTFTLKYPDRYEDKSIWREWVEEVNDASPRYVIVHRKFLNSSTGHYMRKLIKKKYRREAEFGGFLVMRREGDPDSET